MAKDIIEKAKVLRERADDSLTSELVSLEEQIWRARFDLHRGHLADTSKVAKLRRQIARVKTIQSERLRQKAAKRSKKTPGAAKAGKPTRAAAKA